MANDQQKQVSLKIDLDSRYIIVDKQVKLSISRYRKLILIKLMKR
jgi:hypothetical protein